MNLNYLLKDSKNNILSTSSSLDLDIAGLAIDSKQVKQGFIFFCLKGSRFKGSDFIDAACKNGAIAVILENSAKVRIPRNIFEVRVKDVIKCLASIVDIFYDRPSDNLKMIAVTGTNGKTTITYMIESVLKSQSKEVGVIGTINYRFSNEIFPAKNTTPDIITISEIINKMRQKNIQYLIMEVSSHALAQRRIEGLKFDLAIFTNLTQDHLDYHKTRKDYFLAKSLLFRDYLKKDGVAIINKDDAFGEKLIDLIKKNAKNMIVTYGIDKKADVYADKIRFYERGTSFTVHKLGKKFNVSMNLIGRFNVYNALASICASMILDVPEEIIIKGLENVSVPGRLERIDYNNHNIRIFIDYAHTEDALKNTLLSLRAIQNKGRLITVFGCGGDRDRDKRHKMGSIASRLSDFVILTSDNPRSEDPTKIISEIRKGIKKDNYFSLLDRKEAINKAIEIARRKDIVLVAGKGHEDYQIIKDKKLAFSDRDIIEDILSKKGLH